MKILIATGLFPPDIGGPATYSKLLADELPKKGVAVDVRSFGDVRHLPPIIRHIAYAGSLIWHARTADVIFAQDVFSVGVPAMFAAHLLGKVFMVRVPGDYSWEQAHRFGVTDGMEEFQTKRYGFRVELMRKIQRLVVWQADQIIVPSRRFSDVVRSWLKSNQDKVTTIYNGVDIAEIQRLSGGVTYQPKTIISAGRLVPGKGFGMLVRAMKKLPGWRLEIAGDGPEKAALETAITEAGVGDQVVLAGRIGRDELVKRIAASELFVLNTAFETFSFQVVEAMAAGTPVIATKVGSLPELIDDGMNGTLITPDDEGAFLAAVQGISSDKTKRDRLVSEAKKKSTMFSIDSTVGSVKETAVQICSTGSKLLKRRQLIAKLVRYLFSGGMAAVTDLVLLYVFTDVFGMWYVLSSILAFLIAFFVSFILQKFFTYQDHGTDGLRGQAIIYLTVTSANLALNTLFVYLLVQYMSLHYIPAQIVASIIVAIESYVLYGMFIFKTKAPKA